MMGDKFTDSDILLKYTDLNLKYAELQTQNRAMKNEIATLSRELSKHLSDALPEDSKKIALAYQTII
jgi:hypothetical protein